MSIGTIILIILIIALLGGFSGIGGGPFYGTGYYGGGGLGLVIVIPHSAAHGARARNPYHDREVGFRACAVGASTMCNCTSGNDHHNGYAFVFPANFLIAAFIDDSAS